jgi:hypothetical protein
MMKKRMINQKFILMLFLLAVSLITSGTLLWFFIVPIIEGDVSGWQLLLPFLIIPSLAFNILILYLLPRSFLFMIDENGYYVLHRSFPRINKKIILNQHYQITKREYKFNDGVESRIRRDLIITDGYHTHKILMIPLKWLHLIEKRDGHVDTLKVGLGERMEYPPMF